MADMAKERISSDLMDEQRQENIAYEYLCHLEEAKIWIEACVKEELPPATELEENLRNGVYLAKIANFFNPNLVPQNKIYDVNQAIYKAKGLQFRHTDNINHWFTAMDSIHMPKYIYPDTFDIYDRRNIPKAIYCIHELSIILHNQGKAPRIEDLLGKAVFSNDEINAMQVELEKSGVQMPAFAKLGQDVDTSTSTWDIIIAINKALDDDRTNIMKFLNNPKARFSEVVPTNEQRYRDELTFSRHVKVNNTYNQDLDASIKSIPGETYDNLLDKMDIQECVFKANEAVALEEIEDAVVKRNTKALLKCLSHPHLNFVEVIPQYASYYLENLNKEPELTKQSIQTIVEITNEEAREKQNLVAKINQAISKEDKRRALRDIQKLIKGFGINQEDPLEPSFFFEEFLATRNYSQSDLSYEEILGGVVALKAIWNINLAIRAKDTNGMIDALKNPDAHLFNVVHILKDDYYSRFEELLSSKATKGRPLYFSHTEIQEILDDLWRVFEYQNQRSNAQDAINSALHTADLNTLFASLLNPAASILCVKKPNVQLYLWGLQLQREEKGESQLNLDEVQSAITRANKEVELASKICYSLWMVNTEVERDSTEQLLTELRSPHLKMMDLKPNLAGEYHEALRKFKLLKTKSYANEENDNGFWIYCVVGNGHKFYRNLQTHETSWTQPKCFTHSIFLTQQDIEQIIKKVNMNFHVKCQNVVEKQVTLIQAYSRGYLVRKALTEREYHLEKLEEEAIVIQRWWRKCLKSKNAKDYVQLLRRVGGIRAAAVKIQSFFRRYQAQNIYDEKKRAQHVTVERNQAIQELMSKDPFSYVSIYLHLLKVDDTDYEEEMELHKIRGQVVKKIKSNKDLEEKVNGMDLKIALLIKNQLSARELLLHGNKVSRIDSNRRQTMEPGDGRAGLINLQSFNKESRFLLEGYQNLFYTLQTDPKYLARLIYSMAPGKSAKFIDTVIYTLYNYGSTPREQCLLLQLFKHALEEEVKMKVEKAEDVCKGTPLVFKMIVDFNKTGCGHSCLRELLEPLVINILEDETLHLSTDPVEVYKRWVNEQETTTGVMSQLPYDLKAEEAEKIPEVASRIANSIAQLREKTEMFINRILNSVDLLPYGIRYTSKVLHNLLSEKFEDEKKVMKAVGNLLYYRYMIAAIPAADAFGVITLQPGCSINSVQRKNLGAIAKVLQHAAAFQLFDQRSKLSALNGYLEKCHNKCLRFLKVACDVEEPEILFCLDAYSEATLLAHPQVILSLQEIVTTHQLLCEYRHHVVPDANDKLHILLEDLGNPITLETNEEKDSSNTVCLSLTNKFLEAQEISPYDQLFLTTKQMVIQLLQCQTIGITFLDMLRAAPSKEDEEKYTLHKSSVECRSVKELLGRYANINELRHQIMRNLRKLEDRNYVTKQCHYKEMMEAIAKVIANRRLYRERRKEEIYKLKCTLELLSDKSTHYHQTLSYYNEYIRNCLERMAPKPQAKKSRLSILGRDDIQEFEKPIVVKYNATKLQEKGIILEITGLETSQLKHVSFVITASKKTGVYIVKATFMGAAVETVELDIQTLLQQQFEGIMVLEIFGKAKININLLLHLLNKKFVN